MLRPIIFAALIACGTPVQADQHCAPGQIICDPVSGPLGGLLSDLMRQVDPWLAELAQMLGDVSGWHAPEVLENGDILIRRRQPVEPEVAPPDDGPVTHPLEL